MLKISLAAVAIIQTIKLVKAIERVSINCFFTQHYHNNFSETVVVLHVTFQTFNLDVSIIPANSGRYDHTAMIPRPKKIMKPSKRGDGYNEVKKVQLPSK